MVCSTKIGVIEMADKTFSAQVRIQRGGHHGYELVRTQIVAQTQYQAKQMLEAMYGRGCIVGQPTEVR